MILRSMLNAQGALKEATPDSMGMADIYYRVVAVLLNAGTESVPNRTIVTGVSDRA